jgi:hypothetical protein
MGHRCSDPVGPKASSLKGVELTELARIAAKQPAGADPPSWRKTDAGPGFEWRENGSSVARVVGRLSSRPSGSLVRRPSS